MAVNSDPQIHQLVMCANMFVKKEGKVLLIKRSLDKVHLPGFVQSIGGKMDLHEDPFEAAKRELLEEAGIEVENIRLEAVITDINLNEENAFSTHWLVFYFSGEYLKGEVKQTDEGELIWFSPTEVTMQKSLECIQLIVGQLFDSTHGVIFGKYNWKKVGKELISKEVSIVGK